MLTSVFLHLLDTAKTGSFLILFVIVVRILLKKMPKKFTCILWAAVFFRLLCPVRIELPYSVLPYETPLSETYILEDAQLSPQMTSAWFSQTAAGADYVQYNEPAAVVSGEEVISRWMKPWQYFAWWGKYIWLTGFIIFILYSVFSYRKLKTVLSASVSAGDHIRISDYIDTPFVLGLLHPVIYLPSSLDESVREIVLKHEGFHIRRKDHIFKFFAYIAVGLHWLNPLVWLAFILCEKDMEMSCDEEVIRQSPSAFRTAYCAALLEMAAGRKIRLSIPLAFNEGNPESRIRNIADWHVPGRKAVIFTAAVCTALSLSMLVSQAKSSDTVTLSSFGNTFNLGWTFELKSDFGKTFDTVSLSAVSCHDGIADDFIVGSVSKEQKDVSVICLMPRTAEDNFVRIILRQDGKPDQYADIPVYPETIRVFGTDPAEPGTVFEITRGEPARLGVLHLSGTGRIIKITSDFDPSDLYPEEQLIIFRITPGRN